jgi:hypothetical protein
MWLYIPYAMPSWVVGYESDYSEVHRVICTERNWNARTLVSKDIHGSRYQGGFTKQGFPTCPLLTTHKGVWRCSLPGDWDFYWWGEHWHLVIPCAPEVAVGIAVMISVGIELLEWLSPNSDIQLPYLRLLWQPQCTVVPKPQSECYDPQRSLVLAK